ncbi:hypothetical protein NliqN6_5281 [Naganishia liquefaciens]|uniref:Pre-rRNA-processing protein n=1 Tax=Naganishia liquefaciens TaxID=104408 RepID=A0A8H3TZ69_9TREE|nr:hypothetical protein NliqN6_5281 [Naganishia liquefaciens]
MAPKVTKKQKAKAADFSKAKLKLGKGKQAANNATDTSYKARSIALPSQNPLLRSLKDDAEAGTASSIPTSKRGLTLDDVLGNLHHHNAGVKKDALGELKDVLVNGVELGVQMGQRQGEIGRVIRGVLGLISNEESSVRKALLQFLGWYLMLLQPDTLAPYMNELLLQASMGLSHIYHDIRIDACRLISLLLLIAPIHVVGAWPRNASSAQANEHRILDGLRLVAGIGGRAGEGGQNGLNLLPTSKLVILETLLAFVKSGLRKQGMRGSTAAREGRASTAAQDLQVPSDIFEPFQPRYPVVDRLSSTTTTGTRQDKGKGREILPLARLSDTAVDESGQLFDGWLVAQWDQTGCDGDTQNGLWSLASIGRRAEDAEEENIGQALSSLYMHMHPLLLATLMESAPVAFSLSSMTSNPAAHVHADVHLSLCRTIMELVSVLGGQVLVQRSNDPATGTEVKKAISAIIVRMSAYFPFGSSVSAAERIGAEVKDMHEQLCLYYANIVVLLPAAPGRLPPRQKTSNPHATVQQMTKEFERVARARSAKDEENLRRVADWLAELLEGNADVLRPSLSPHSYLAILPIVWALWTGSSLASTEEDASVAADVCEGFLGHLLRTSSDSVTRRLGNDFVVRMVMVLESTYPVRPFFIPAKSTSHQLLQRWLESLPRVIWELDAKDETATGMILDFLLWLQQRDTRLFDGATLDNVASRLHPFFHLDHPSRGAVAGPWTRLTSESLRMLAVDVAFTWKARGQLKLTEAVDKAVQGFDAARAHWESLCSL